MKGRHKLVLAIVVAAAAGAAAVVSLPQYRGPLLRALPRAGRPVSPSATMLRVSIEGMDCIMCSGVLQQRLAQARGVRRAEVSFQDREARIEFDPRLTDEPQLEKFITQAGFKVAHPARPGKGGS